MTENSLPFFIFSSCVTVSCYITMEDLHYLFLIPMHTSQQLVLSAILINLGEWPAEISRM